MTLSIIAYAAFKRRARIPGRSRLPPNPGVRLR